MSEDYLATEKWWKRKTKGLTSVPCKIAATDVEWSSCLSFRPCFQSRLVFLCFDSCLVLYFLQVHPTSTVLHKFYD